MQWKKFSYYAGHNKPYWIPSDLNLQMPKNSMLPIDQQHFLAYIPWEDKYLDLIPEDFKIFFKHIKDKLSARTTDVHTAICLGMLDEFLINFPEVNRRILGLSLILHDIGWSNLTEQEIALSLGVSGLQLTDSAFAPKIKHAVLGQKIAKEILDTYKFNKPLNEKEVQLILKAIRYHDEPWEIKNGNNEIPIEVKLLVDLDHIWSFTYQNFWQDTARKGVSPEEYADKLEADISSYFISDFGKQKAGELLEVRRVEINNLKKFIA